MPVHPPYGPRPTFYGLRPAGPPTAAAEATRSRGARSETQDRRGLHPGADDPSEWPISRRTGKPRDRISTPPDTPPRGLPTADHWSSTPPTVLRPATGCAPTQGRAAPARAEELETVNTALHLRCPLLVTGKPGTGKSTLPHAIAHELGLSRVLRWPVTSRTVPGDGLYHYDTIARLQNSQIASRTRGAPAGGLDSRIRLGQPGTATPPTAKPRYSSTSSTRTTSTCPTTCSTSRRKTSPPRTLPGERRSPAERHLTPHSTMNDLPLPGS